MATASTPIIRHVSRRELAQNRYVWLATGGMYALFAVTTAGLIMFVGGLSPLRMQVMAAILLVIAVVHLRSEPPALGSVGNHLVLVSAWAVVGVAFWAYQPGGGLALGGMMFIGPLAAVRLQDRRQIAAHLVASNALALTVGVFGGLDIASVLAITLMTLGSGVLCYSCVVVLEAAESQGDELERLVRRDPLTGVGNRRLLSERLADEITKHARTQRPLVLIALDLNGFKLVNDDQGHAAGDELLRDVATTLLRVTDDHDTVVRQGGDEFCIVMPETTPAVAERTTNAIRAELAKLDIQTGIGVASFPEDAIDAQVLLHVADERLRANKKPVARATSLPGGVVAPFSASPGRMFS